MSKTKVHWESYDKGFAKGERVGFARALGLAVGVHPKWTRRDLDMRRPVTRKYFGKKRR
jgi:hypothetical protein